MRLLRCKVSGHFVLQNSDWFTVDSKSTTIAAPAGSGKRTLLRALRSVNPPLCDNDPAPFAEFPQFATVAGHRRKVLPAKKTAVIAVFVCDDRLREELAAIDPVYWETDRIEVGRRLDNSRWTTFVEVAASSRWSELEEEFGRLRQLFGECAALASFLQETGPPRPAARVKGKLAEGLRELVDRLTAEASTEAQQHLLQKVQWVVERASRYRKAVDAVERALPVMVFLDRNCLVSGRIQVGAAAGNTALQQGCTCCADFFLQELLGMQRYFAGQREGERITPRLQEQASALEKDCRQLGERLSSYLPNILLKLSLFSDQERAEVLASVAGGAFIPLHEVAEPLRWMLSCAFISCYFVEQERRDVILLLDEPDIGLADKAKKELAAFLLRLSGSHQVVVCTAGPAFPPKSRRRYRLKKEDGGSTVVDLDENRSSAR